MRLAIPCEENRICPHFGHAPQFGFFDTDPATGRIENERFLAPPSHQPGMLPKWVASQGADVVLASGMGARAVGLFEQHGVKVVLGVIGDDPRAAAESYLKGNLEGGGNPCDQSGCQSECK